MSSLVKSGRRLVRLQWTTYSTAHTRHTYLIYFRHHIWRPSQCSAVLSLLKNKFFWPSYCQISTDLDKILHTLIVIQKTLVGRLTSRSARERLKAKPGRISFFGNSCNAP